MQENTTATVTTPALLLDKRKMQRNIDRMARRAEQLGVKLRPHLKTCKAVDVARRVVSGKGSAATVSTLAEAEVFAQAGVKDILYAVGIAPQKLQQVLNLRNDGCDLSIVLETIEQAQAVVEASRQAGHTIPALIEIDSDGHRGGIRYNDAQLLEIGRLLHEGAELRGVMTHAGGSYGDAGKQAHAEWAERERHAAVSAATQLRDAGMPCPVVSVGSTPTAMAARDLDGVTELRAGVYVFFDLVMKGIGVCETEDIAASVLTTVIGGNPSKNTVLVDAGWMALSRDRGTAHQAVDQGYGLVCDEDGEPYQDLIVTNANQEHGSIALRPGSDADFPELPIGTRLRILPNHVCATAAQHSEYKVLADNQRDIAEVWPRFGGW